MTTRISRRAVLGIAAVGTAVAATGASLSGVRACHGRNTRIVASDRTVADYIDRDGWILTPADEKTLGTPLPRSHP
jgi:hypothetical protein